MKPSASTTRNSRIASVAQIRPVMTTSSGSDLSAERAEDALLEAVVELDDPVRQRQARDHPPAEVPHREQSPTARITTTTTPIANTIWTSGGSPLRKLQ